MDHKKLAVIVNSGSYERVAFALQMAIGAAAIDEDVDLLFGYGGLVRLKKCSADEVSEETEHWMRGRIQSGLETGTVPRISQLLDTLLKLGGRIYACPAAMSFHNLIRGELIEGVNEVCSLGDFLGRKAPGATVIYV